MECPKDAPNPNGQWVKRNSPWCNVDEFLMCAIFRDWIDLPMAAIRVKRGKSHGLP